MRITIRRSQPPTDTREDGLGTRTLPQSTVEEVHVPNRALLQAGGAVGLASGLVTLLMSLGTYWLVERPKAEQAGELTADKSRMEALDRALGVETMDGRRTSLRLLVATGVLDPEHPERLEALLAGKDTLPRWPPRGDSRDRSSPGTTPPRTPPTDTTARP
jgi:hypothetical protein